MKRNNVKLFSVKRTVIDFEQANVMGKNVIKIPEDIEERWLYISFLFYKMQKKLMKYYYAKKEVEE